MLNIIYNNNYRLDMILTEYVEVKVTIRNLEHFYNFGYTYIYLGCYIDIPVALMQRGSQQEITCKCDVCGIEKDVIYKNYVKYLGGQTWGTYFFVESVQKLNVRIH